MTDQGQIPIKIELFGIGTLEGHIIRHIAPLSADAIINKMPIIVFPKPVGNITNEFLFLQLFTILF